MPHIFLGDKLPSTRVDAIKAVFDTRSDIFDTSLDYSTDSVYVKLKNSQTGFRIQTQQYSESSDGVKLIVCMYDSTGTMVGNEQSILYLGYNIKQTWFDYLPTKDGILFGGYQVNQAQSHDTYVVPCYAGTECIMAINSSSRGFICSKTATIMDGAELYLLPVRISQEAIAISNVYAGDDTFFEELYFTTVRPPSASETVYTATVEGENYYIPSPYAQSLYYFFAVKAPQET